ncbi:TQXA domain-containing protein [Gordonia crocea]|uniref:Thioester domain-containing protein n=1 Tax=Gordonia crocea TaxID=589162 RepID=A0A7I9V314_9ACTN|nr:TQXA domain-containing protein [Gordonia crocea]GED99430.1 hypothetical protein nbrc107697_34690 [Gordonia crocea]
MSELAFARPLPRPVIPVATPAASPAVDVPPFERLTRYRGGTYSPTVARIRFADGTTARTDLIRLNPDVSAYSLDFNGMVTDSPTVYRPRAWDRVTGVHAARFRASAISTVLHESYPVVGLRVLSDRLRAAGYALGAANLREHEAIAATQAAIWRLTNNLELDTVARDEPVEVRVVDEAEGSLIEVAFADDVVLGGFSVGIGSDSPADRFAVRLLKPTARGWVTVAGSVFETDVHGTHARTLGEAATIRATGPAASRVGHRRYRLDVSAAGRVRLDDLRFRIIGSRYANDAPIVQLYRYLLDSVGQDAGRAAAPVGTGAAKPWVLLADDASELGLTPLITVR